MGGAGRLGRRLSLYEGISHPVRVEQVETVDSFPCILPSCSDTSTGITVYPLYPVHPLGILVLLRVLPAMEAGITDHVWTIEEMIRTVIPS